MSVTKDFGKYVFSETVMRERLSKHVFSAMEETIRNGKHVEADLAEPVAQAMKDWAIELGATHYTHWFQPLTGTTAEKHDSFINPAGAGKAVMTLSGKELVKGEPDASSFPSGGIRETCAARGYTVWDPTSPAFVKDDTLYIPTVFCSYTGEVLDKKTPLLRSMNVVSDQAVRVLKLFGQDVKRVVSSVGPEQEYFLVDKKYYDERQDLILTGRTLFGAMAPKGQELEDHYFANLKQRVSDYMKDLDQELWKLGIFAKTKHNEVAPAQHELASIYSTTNVAIDNNNLVMEMMKKVALKHGLVCLLHEKPFKGVNGSGKHNNWSLATDTGENLLKGKNDKKFLLFLVATIKAVNEYGDLMRASVASAGNDHRLGANEAPPAIISIYLGEQLSAVLSAIESGKPIEEAEKEYIPLGIDFMPDVALDSTDRNRTSPFAYTGNKFEFRTPGSNVNISEINIVLNTIVADVLEQFADKLEKAKAEGNFEEALDKLIRDTYIENKRIIFDGNGYSEEWIAEAERRGLPNLKATPDALPVMLEDKNVKVFERHGIFTKAEIEARCNSMLEEYSKLINIEARTMIEMSKRQIQPACLEYSTTVLANLQLKEESGMPAARERELAEKLCELSEELATNTDELEKLANESIAIESNIECAKAFESKVLVKMREVRRSADTLETMVSKEYWPMPTYTELLFGV